ncbi:MAG: DNA (cytosine-5-)-methyltransferase [Bacteroidetes bacterium]|nr:DNA (cytosine-5-)-methyltransferase [Bacteroidota bacterium]
MAKLSVNSFFTGIGGFDLGFERQGFKITYQCEINQFCQSVLKKHWPRTICDYDILSVDPGSLPEAKIWCAGFPCQDVSVARGSMGRQGLKGKNSGLFYDFLQLIEKRMPDVVLLENVLGLLSSHNGNDFRIILDSFNNLGYGVSWRVFNSKFFGVPQSRQRVYICAWKNNVNKAAYVLHEFNGSEKTGSPRSEFVTPHKNDIAGFTVPSLAYCLAATSGRHTGTDWSRTYICYDEAVRRLIPSEAEALQGFPKNWTSPETFSKTNILDYDSLRYHAIGNAVSVPVIEWIATRIKKAFQMTMEDDLDTTLANYKDFTKKGIRCQDISNSDNEHLKWRTGGISAKNQAFDCKVYDAPSNKVTTNLISIISTENIDSKYFLSPVAARGILRRVESQNRELFQPLQNSLERLSNLALAKAI